MFFFPLCESDIETPVAQLFRLTEPAAGTFLLTEPAAGTFRLTEPAAETILFYVSLLVATGI
jgi:hypothetical protein